MCVFLFDDIIQDSRPYGKLKYKKSLDFPYILPISYHILWVLPILPAQSAFFAAGFV